MRPIELPIDVFDFDGTLINANSYKAVCRAMLLTFMRRGMLIRVSAFIWVYLQRRLYRLSHIDFKSRMMGIFEDYLDEPTKREVIQEIFQKNHNPVILKKLRDAKNAVVSTAAPWNYMSKLDFGFEVYLIASLDPSKEVIDKTNYGQGKIDNIEAIFSGKCVVIENLYTDDPDADRAVLNIARRTHVVKRGQIMETLESPTPYGQ